LASNRGHVQPRGRGEIRAERTSCDIRALAFVPYPQDTTPSQRFRFEQWLPVLAAEGLHLDLRPFLGRSTMAALYQPGRRLRKAAGLTWALFRRLGVVAALRRCDVVLVHRAANLVGPAWVERLVRVAGRPLIYDFDDAIYLLHTSSANSQTAWLKFPGKTARICRLAQRVVVANAGLAEYARRYNSQVAVIPSSVDTQRFHPRAQAPRERVVVGWTGSSTSMTHLEAFASVLLEIQRRYHVDIRVHSDRRANLPGVDYDWRPWSPANEPEELAEFDIGIMPMPDDPWARGKSAMKALLCMAVGVPVVCSAVGTNRDVVVDGVNGFLARDTADWLPLVGRLIDDASLRARLGAGGRRTVERGYSAERSARLFASVVRECVAEWASR
jgi:glycosyltransferase involved in cell wall biosynthesis